MQLLGGMGPTTDMSKPIDFEEARIDTLHMTNDRIQSRGRGCEVDLRGGQCQATRKLLTWELVSILL